MSNARRLDEAIPAEEMFDDICSHLDVIQNCDVYKQTDGHRTTSSMYRALTNSVEQKKTSKYAVSRKKQTPRQCAIEMANLNVS